MNTTVETLPRLSKSPRKVASVHDGVVRAVLGIVPQKEGLERLRVDALVGLRCQVSGVVQNSSGLQNSRQLCVTVTEDASNRPWHPVGVSMGGAEYCVPNGTSTVQ